MNYHCFVRFVITKGSPSTIREILFVFTRRNLVSHRNCGQKGAWTVTSRATKRVERITREFKSKTVSYSESLAQFQNGVQSSRQAHLTRHSRENRGPRWKIRCEGSKTQLHRWAHRIGTNSDSLATLCVLELQDTASDHPSRITAAVNPEERLSSIRKREQHTRKVNRGIAVEFVVSRAQSSPAPKFLPESKMSARARADTRQRNNDFGNSFPRRARRQVAGNTRTGGRRRGGGNSRWVKARETRYPPADGR